MIQKYNCGDQSNKENKFKKWKKDHLKDTHFHVNQMFFIALLFQEVKENLAFLQIFQKNNSKKDCAIQIYINKENSVLKLKQVKETLISYLFVKALVIFDDASNLFEQCVYLYVLFLKNN